MDIRLHNGVGRMSIHSPIFLKPDTVVNIDGKEFTAAELKEHVIDSVLYRKHLQKLMGENK